ncbi:acyltransferase family protein [Terriglobus tenax]|uniref:acyltransferase family protein n=1 Tax=Terriglobus tenax TaxID=1111115 RepID=UPI0021E0CDF7|nr:acyltransferase [Terriglobus tenax]
MTNDSQELSRPFGPLSFKNRMPALDGLRAMAITMVFLEHYGGGSHGGGILRLFNQFRENLWVGVDLFFVLSGFLITGILYDTREDSHYFKRFFARRAVRIFPVYYGIFAVMGLLTLIFHYQWFWLQSTFLIYLGNFFGNWNFDLYSLASPTHPLAYISFGHFWSLCVEEQFYLVWPLVVWMVRDRIKLIRIASVIAVLAFLSRVAMFALAGPELAERWVVRALPFRADALLIGAILALIFRGERAAAWQRRCLPVFLASLAIAMGILAMPVPWPNPWVFTVGYVFIALAAAGLIGMTIRTGTRTFRVFNIRPLRMIGKYSYGFYVFHYLFAHAWIGLLVLMMDKLHSVALAGLIVIPLNFVVTFIAAKLSFDLFESKVLKLKSRFTYDLEQQAHQHAYRT